MIGADEQGSSLVMPWFLCIFLFCTHV